MLIYFIQDYNRHPEKRSNKKCLKHKIDNIPSYVVHYNNEDLADIKSMVKINSERYENKALNI